MPSASRRVQADQQQPRGLRAFMCGVMALMLCASAEAQPAEKQDATNWPDTIARLQQEVYQRPGLAYLRQQLAVAYNNYGVALSQQGQWDLAARQLQEAMRLAGGDAQFTKNLSNVYLNQAYEAHQRYQMAEATNALDKALALDPNLAQAYTLRGEIEYGRQRLKEAKAAWQRALELDPNQPDLAKRLEQVTQELPVESRFERLSQAYFDLRYEEQLEQPVGFDVRDALLDARRTVGGDFAYWPKHKIVVLIYSAESFRRIKQETPDWVAGQFDGKIRVPLPGTQLDPATVKQILFHEYTHALVFDLASGNCPTWFNEGLAEYEGARQKPPTFTRLTRAIDAKTLIPWAKLSDQFSTSLPLDEVTLGYQEAHSAVRYLVKRYGFWRVRRILKSLADGQPFEDALASEFRVKAEKLEAAWLAALPELLQGAP